MASDNPHKEKFEQFCAGYVLHTLEEAERQEFEQMLEDASEEERTLYQNMHSAVNQLVFTVKGNEPGPAVKEQLMSHIRSGGGEIEQEDSPVASEIMKETEEPENGFDWFSFAVAASFALLIITMSLIFYSFSLNSDISELESNIEQQKAQLTELEHDLREREEILSVLGAREVEIVELSGMDVNPNGYGKVIWNGENRQIVLQASNLPAVSQGREYQLWALTPDSPISAGVFAVNEETNNFYRIELPADILQSVNGFAVTMEPEGGSQQPTGNMYLMGNVDDE